MTCAKENYLHVKHQILRRVLLNLKNKSACKRFIPRDQIADENTPSKEFLFALVIITVIMSPAFFVEFFMETG